MSGWAEHIQPVAVELVDSLGWWRENDAQSRETARECLSKLGKVVDPIARTILRPGEYRMDEFGLPADAGSHYALICYRAWVDDDENL